MINVEYRVPANPTVTEVVTFPYDLAKIAGAMVLDPTPLSEELKRRLAPAVTLALPAFLAYQAWRRTKSMPLGVLAGVGTLLAEAVVGIGAIGAWLAAEPSSGDDD